MTDREHLGPSGPRKWLLPAAVLLLAAASVALTGEKRRSITRPIQTEPLQAARYAKQNGGELVRMHWKLGGFLGSIAGLFLPSAGDTLLTFTPDADGHTLVQLLITAPKRDGEYYLYGAEIDEEHGATTAVWNTYAYRKKRKESEQEIEQADVTDFASGLYHLRWNPPTEPIRQAIWVDGDLHPVDVTPLPPEVRKISGVKIEVQGYELRGSVVDGEREFKERIHVYFARDERVTPVEIVGKRGGVRVRFQHTDPAGLQGGSQEKAGQSGSRKARPAPARQSGTLSTSPSPPRT